MNTSRRNTNDNFYHLFKDVCTAQNKEGTLILAQLELLGNNVKILDIGNHINPEHMTLKSANAIITVMNPSDSKDLDQLLKQEPRNHFDLITLFSSTIPPSQYELIYQQASKLLKENGRLLISMTEQDRTLLSAGARGFFTPPGLANYFGGIHRFVFSIHPKNKYVYLCTFPGKPINEIFIPQKKQPQKLLAQISNKK